VSAQDEEHRDPRLLAANLLMGLSLVAIVVTEILISVRGALKSLTALQAVRTMSLPS
jgi:hypothetical protein